jgi:hypothetical protein
LIFQFCRHDLPIVHDNIQISLIRVDAIIDKGRRKTRLKKHIMEFLETKYLGTQ